jgi:hypothetical protein
LDFSKGCSFLLKFAQKSTKSHALGCAWDVLVLTPLPLGALICNDRSPTLNTPQEQITPEKRLPVTGWNCGKAFF